MKVMEKRSILSAFHIKRKVMKHLNMLTGKAFWSMLELLLDISKLLFDRIKRLQWYESVADPGGGRGGHGPPPWPCKNRS